MQMKARIQGGTSTTITTRKGDQLAKTRVKVIDMGEETGGDLTSYWIDFLGEAALSDDELKALMHHEVTIFIRRVTSSLGKDGKAYTNLTGGAIVGDKGIVQKRLAGQRAA